MKYNITKQIIAVGSVLGVVSCTSLPSDINKGIAAGSPHAYYEAGKHIDNTPVANDAPPLLNLLFLPFDIPLAIFQGPRVASCFYYRSYDSRNRESLKYFKKGADLGDADCQYEMGLCYEKGYGVNSDLGTAKAYYMQAAAQGNANAKERLVGINATSPSSLAGRRLYIDYSNAQFLPLGASRWEAPGMSNESLPSSMIHYKKTGAKTAQACYSPNPESANASAYDFKLYFETPTSGTATMEATVWMGGSGEYKNIRFTIR